ncbi:[LysW]-aminoadipate/[LysW]-glutamate kinase [Candidatus Bathyarchaeota archaeon]|nr:[LysW]-aminoadipate/[LysW]-glutamate kinase [Candidatus Bathyarchaeota archaeon]
MRFVVKIGGSILGIGGTPERALIEDLKALAAKASLTIVHGGGDEVTEMAKRLGKETVFITSPEGFRSRYTDKETLAIYTMVIAGRINKEITSTLQAFEVKALGLSGVDGGLLAAERKKRLIVIDERGRKRAMEGGYTGRIVSVNTELLELLFKGGYVPIVAPLALGEGGEILNVDGDRAAAAIAGALKADKLILLTDVEGLLLNGKVVPRLRSSEAREILPSIGPGMITKVHAALEALEAGVKEAVICSGMGENPVLEAIDGKRGTAIVP